MNDSELDQLLKHYGSPAPPSPAGFTNNVWMRIKAAELNAWQPRMERLLERVLGFFALPPVAVATCATMVVIGAWFGLQPTNSGPPGEISYIHAVSPFAQAHP